MKIGAFSGDLGDSELGNHPIFYGGFCHADATFRVSSSRCRWPLQALELDFQAYLITDATKPVSEQQGASARAELQHLGLGLLFLEKKQTTNKQTAKQHNQKKRCFFLYMAGF